jgi:2-hydroxychromene-2-carboxylate isomerase
VAELHFYFDPICPFAWMTSKWVREVAGQRPLEVEWRFVSLRMLNANVDYATHFPAGYERSHTAGLELLRVAAAARQLHGPAVVGPFYEAVGTALFEGAPDRQGELHADPRGFVGPILAALGLDTALADAVEATAFDSAIRVETDEALGLTGREVGTPILHFDPPAGTALFGPVISRLPSTYEAVALWDHVAALSRFAGFAELKRSLRETPQLRGLGIEPGEVGEEEDWQQGHRRGTP